MHQTSFLDQPPTPEAVEAHFDVKRGRKLRDEGVHLIEQSNKVFIEAMRDAAINIALIKGKVHIDDLRRRALQIGIKPEHPNAWGAVFRGGKWKKVGYRASEFVTNRGHVSPEWALRRGVAGRTMERQENYRGSKWAGSSVSSKRTEPSRSTAGRLGCKSA